MSLQALPLADRLALDASHDPTGTSRLRGAFRAAGQLQIRQLRAAMRIAVLEHDLLGWSGANISVMAVAPDVRLGAFSHWLTSAAAKYLQNEWAVPYVDKAWLAGTEAAAREVGSDPLLHQGHGPVPHQLLRQELKGVIAAIVQQVGREAARNYASPYRGWQHLSRVFDKVATNRIIALANTSVVQAYNLAKLEVYRGRGITHVGVIPETMPATHDTDDAARRVKPVRRLYGIETANDERVCPTCQDLADDGPYTLGQAIGLIPAHVGCRCAYTVWTGATDSVPRETVLDPELYDFDPAELRNEKGEWTTGGGGESDVQYSQKVQELAVKTPGLKGVLPYLSQDEVDRLRPQNVAKVVEAFASYPQPEEMAAVAFSGSAKRGWYRNSARAIVEIFGAVDAPRFAALLAAMSPQTSVESNAVNALSTWANWVRAGRPTDKASIVRVMGESVQGGKGESSVLPAWINNSVSALSAKAPQELALSGPKVNSFAANLRGAVNAVTLDTWMANYAAISPDEFRKAAGTPGKSATYIGTSAAVRAAAAAASKLTGSLWTPDEIQETVWSWAKTLYERASADKTTVAELLRAGGMTHKDVNDTPDFAVLFTQNVYRKILEEAGYGKQVAAAGGRGAGEVARGGSSLLAAEGSGFAQSAFEQHLFRAAERLDKVRKARSEARVSDEQGDLFDFNPYHEPAGSPEGGRFASGGSSESFVSPSVASNLSFEQARAALGSQAQKELRSISQEIDRTLGITSSTSSVIGAWADGAENSLMVEMHGADPVVERAALAMKGHIADQKQVLLFRHAEDGAHAMAAFRVAGSLDSIHAQLLKDGIAFHTLEPHVHGATVHVFSDSPEGLQQVFKAAKSYGSEVSVSYGQGEFLGTQKTDGTDREQRDDARQEYERVIGEAARSRPGIAEAWRNNRDRWLPRQEVSPPAATDYSPGVKATGELATRAQKKAWGNASKLRTIQQVIDAAPDAQRELSAVINAVAEKHDIVVKAPPGPKTYNQKGIDRTMEKAAARGGVAYVSDVARMSLIIDRPEQAEAVIAELAKHFEITNEPWKTTDVNYTDRAINVRFKNGLMGEVQILEAKMAVTKQENHKYYSATRSARFTNPESLQEHAIAVARQKEAYGRVLDSYPLAWKAALGRLGTAPKS
jgi:hypothetical protein